MATHSSILAWRIPWTEELGGLQSTGRKGLDTTERLHFHFTLMRVGSNSFLHHKSPFPFVLWGGVLRHYKYILFLKISSVVSIDDFCLNQLLC